MICQSYANYYNKLVLVNSQNAKKQQTKLKSQNGSIQKMQKITKLTSTSLHKPRSLEVQFDFEVSALKAHETCTSDEHFSCDKRIILLIIVSQTPILLKSNETLLNLSLLVFNCLTFLKLVIPFGFSGRQRSSSETTSADNQHPGIRKQWKALLAQLERQHLAALERQKNGFQSGVWSRLLQPESVLNWSGQKR